jgi:hypothetical protein
MVIFILTAAVVSLFALTVTGSFTSSVRVRRLIS